MLITMKQKKKRRKVGRPRERTENILARSLLRRSQRGKFLAVKSIIRYYYRDAKTSLNITIYIMH